MGRTRCVGIGLGSLLVAVVLAAAVFAERVVHAHRPITSKFGYNDDIFPIFRDRCGRCHVDGGPAPMSLLTYQDAVPWAESIREELTTEQMPPWYVDPAGPAIRGGNPISAREIDMIITWASGGKPQGTFSRKPAPVVFHPRWRAGQPELTLEMESAHTVPADMAEDTVDFTFPTSLPETKWIKGADLLPGTPSMVRDAVISIETGPVLSMWVPGDAATVAPRGAAFRLAPGARIHLQIHYKKPWQDEHAEKSDRSTVGLYLTDAPTSGREIQTLAISGSSLVAADDPRTSSATLIGAARVIAIRPTLDQPYGSLNVHAVTPSGSVIPLLLLRSPRPEWRRRYWLAEPVEVPSGSRVAATLVRTALASGGTRPTTKYPLQITLEYVPR